MVGSQSVIPIFVLGIFIVVLSACDSTSSSSGPSTGVQPSVAQPQGQPSSSQSPQGRDPLMERGAQFMAVVAQHKQRLEKDPKDKEALLFLGNANYDINRFEQAKGYYLRYLELDAANAGVRTDLATTYYNTKDVDATIRELRTVLTRAPGHEAALYNLGLILARDKQDKGGAVQAWEVLLKTHPDHPKAAEIQKQIDEWKKKS